jgi:hypothetical protein
LRWRTNVIDKQIADRLCYLFERAAKAADERGWPTGMVSLPPNDWRAAASVIATAASMPEVMEELVEALVRPELTAACAKGGIPAPRTLPPADSTTLRILGREDGSVTITVASSFTFHPRA